MPCYLVIILSLSSAPQTFGVDSQMSVNHWHTGNAQSETDLNLRHHFSFLIQAHTPVLLFRSLTVLLWFVLCYLPLLSLSWTCSQLCSLSKYDWPPLEPKPRSGIIYLPAALPAPSDHHCTARLLLLKAWHYGETHEGLSFQLKCPNWPE